MNVFLKVCDCGDVFVMQEIDGHQRIICSPYGTGANAYQALATMPVGSVMTTRSSESAVSAFVHLKVMAVTWLGQAAKAEGSEVPE